VTLARDLATPSRANFKLGLLFKAVRGQS
jgi:hypothetical protein